MKLRSSEDTSSEASISQRSRPRIGRVEENEQPDAQTLGLQLPCNLIGYQTTKRVARNEVGTIWLHPTHFTDVSSGNILDSIVGDTCRSVHVRDQSVQRLIPAKMTCQRGVVESALLSPRHAEKWRPGSMALHRDEH